MEQEIRDRYRRSILDQALEVYQISPDEIEELDGFESYIYAFNRNQEDGILRIAHSIRRTPDLIRGELDWINYLHQGGVRVARPLQSINGDWLEELDDGEGGFFLAVAFDKAPGEPHRGPVWPEPLLREYGRQIGRMHQLSTKYQLSDRAWKRPEWDDPINLEINQFLPVEDHKIKKIYQDLSARIKTLPVDLAGYGLIHQDAHQGNFFVSDEGEITFFDFDDSVYSWFVNDIALVLFYAVMGQEDPGSFTEKFLTGYLPGYYAEYNLDPKWFREIPLFMKLREIDLYAVIHRSFDVENLDDPWCIWYMDGRKENLEEELPYLDFDFEEFDFQQFT
ncbi:MAG: phosphotransferase [Chloroflexi bacterium]|nr:phosphotransferase [Chloroflexota bacterium]